MPILILKYEAAFGNAIIALHESGDYIAYAYDPSYPYKDRKPFPFSTLNSYMVRSRMVHLVSKEKALEIAKMADLICIEDTDTKNRAHAKIEKFELICIEHGVMKLPKLGSRAYNQRLHRFKTLYHIKYERRTPVADLIRNKD